MALSSINDDHAAVINIKMYVYIALLLLQVNDELLQVLLSQRRHAATTLSSSTAAAAAVVAPLCIKGDPLLRSEAVLCSRDKTYGLKRVETSNSRTNDDHS